LGLSIAREIVRMHGGQIWAESEGPGKGSVFHIRLPLAAPATQAPPAAAPSALPSRSAPSLRVLVIDDSRDTLQLMKMELEALGYRVLPAADAQAGLELARREAPDIIISDVKMPGTDGYELMRGIRLLPGLDATPAIALTGLGGESHRQALAAGYQAHITKPVDVEDLSRLIQSLVSGAASRRAQAS
jgi:CheY-like chemotaxis protein